jgi:hypothetical protein
MEQRLNSVLLRKKYKNTTVCPYCTKKLSSSKYLIIHLNLHLQEYTYKCKFCPEYNTYSFKTLSNHFRKKHK